jgi:ATP-binding protein involved in chromosome partitioning
MAISREDVLACLKAIQDPSGADIVEAGLVRALDVTDGAVRFVMEVASPDPYLPIKAEAEEKLAALGASSVSIVMTAHSKPTPPPDLKPSRQAEPAGPQKIPGVARLIAVASGKGGVGKSTVASNLACALAAEGRRVGMLDADVYGPSQPRMLGVSGRPQSPDGKLILPWSGAGRC